MSTGKPITKKLTKMSTGKPITNFLGVNQLGLKILGRLQKKKVHILWHCPKREGGQRPKPNFRKHLKLWQRLEGG